MKRRGFFTHTAQALAAIGVGQLVLSQNTSQVGTTYQRLEAAPKGRRFALLIGINRYPQAAQYPDLAGCHQDVTLQRQLLQARFGVLSENIVTLLDEAATIENLTAVFDQLQTQLSATDALLVHFSGYGTLLQRAGAERGWEAASGGEVTTIAAADSEATTIASTTSSTSPTSTTANRDPSLLKDLLKDQVTETATETVTSPKATAIKTATVTATGTVTETVTGTATGIATENVTETVTAKVKPSDRGTTIPTTATEDRADPALLFAGETATPLRLDDLLQRLRSLPTRNVITVLDAGYVWHTAPDAVKLNTRSRPAIVASSASTWRDRTPSRPSLRDAQPRPLALTYGAAAFAAEMRWSEFDAGILTYALTQQLWHASSWLAGARRSAIEAEYRLGLADLWQIYTDRLGQTSGLTWSFNDGNDWTLAAEQSDRAIGAVQEVLNKDEIIASLGGLPPTVLEVYSPGSLFLPTLSPTLAPTPVLPSGGAIGDPAKSNPQPTAQPTAQAITQPTPQPSIQPDPQSTASAIAPVTPSTVSPTVSPTALSATLSTAASSASLKAQASTQPQTQTSPIAAATAPAVPSYLQAYWRCKSRNGVQVSLSRVSNGATNGSNLANNLTHPDNVDLTPLSVGMTLMEQVRVIPRSINLKVALATHLERIERVDTTSALSSVRGIEVIASDDHSVDCAIGRVRQSTSPLTSSANPLNPSMQLMGQSDGQAAIVPETSPKTSPNSLEAGKDPERAGETREDSATVLAPLGGYSLLSLNATPLFNCAATTDEAVKRAVQRLTPQLYALRAFKVLSALENPWSSGLKVRITLERSQPDPTQPDRGLRRSLQTVSVTQAPLTSNQGLLTIPLGSRMQYRLENFDDRPLYPLFVRLDPCGRLTIPTLPESKVNSRTTLFLPAQPATMMWNLENEAGLVRVFALCSDRPFTTLQTLLTNHQNYPNANRDLTREPDTADFAGDLTQAILTDLHAASASHCADRCPPLEIPTDSYALHVNAWTTFAFTYRVSLDA